MPSNKLLSPSKFFGEERYQKYLEEITSQGTVEGEELTPEERKEAFKKRGNKISFKSFVNKLLAKKKGVGVSTKNTTPSLSGRGAIVKRSSAPIQSILNPPVSEKTQENLDDIMKGIDSILETLKEDQKLEKDTQKLEKKQKEKAKRARKEEKLESKVFKGLTKTIGKVIQPVKSLFERLFDFLGTVLLGRVLVKFVDWFTDEKNKEKLDAIGRFLKDTWPALAVGILAFGTGIGRFITRLTFMVSKWTFRLVKFVIPKLVGFIAKHPLATAAIGVGIGAAALAMRSKDSSEQILEDRGKADASPKEQADELSKPMNIMETLTRTMLPSLNEPKVEGRSGGGLIGFSGGMSPIGTDTVPAMLTPGEFVMSKGAVNTFGADTLASMNAAGGGTNKPKYFNGSMFANGGGYVEKKEELSPKLKSEMKKRSGDEKVSGGGGKAWWDFLGWAGTGKPASDSGLTDIQKKALGILAKYESGAAGYNAVNQIGTAGGRGVKGFSGDIRKMSQHKGRPLTDFTIAEIKGLQFDDRSMSDDQWIKSGKLHAVGKYQFIGNTLPGVAKRAGIPDDAKFSEGVQDLMALQLMKERGISPWVGPSDKATAAERSIIAQARGQEIEFNPSMPKGSMIAATPSGQSGVSASSAPPTPKTSLASLRKAIDFKPATSAPSVGPPVSSMNLMLGDLRAAIDGASAPQTSNTAKTLNNEIPNISAAIMQSPSKVKTLGVTG